MRIYKSILTHNQPKRRTVTARLCNHIHVDADSNLPQVPAPIYDNLSRARSEVARGASGVRVSRDAMRASQLEGRRALGDFPISLVSPKWSIMYYNVPLRTSVTLFLSTHIVRTYAQWTYNTLRAIDRLPLSWVASNRLDPRERNVSMSSNPSNTQYADILDLPAELCHEPRYA
jgi:hypothetical protein